MPTLMLSVLLATASAQEPARGPATLLSPSTKPPPGDVVLEPFSNIQVAGDVDLNLFGNVPQRTAEVRCPTSEGPGVVFEVRGETLMVRPQHEGRRTTGQCLAVVRASGIKQLEVAGASVTRGGALSELTIARLAGAGRLDLRGLSAPQFQLQAAGAGLVQLSGAVDALTLEVSGAAEIQAKNLVAQHGILKVTGSGTMEVTVRQSVAATSAGAGAITVHGTPPKVEKNALGAGQIVIQ